MRLARVYVIGKLKPFMSIIQNIDIIKTLLK